MPTRFSVEYFQNLDGVAAKRLSHHPKLRRQVAPTVFLNASRLKREWVLAFANTFIKAEGHKGCTMFIVGALMYVESCLRIRLPGLDSLAMEAGRKVLHDLPRKFRSKPPKALHLYVRSTKHKLKQAFGLSIATRALRTMFSESLTVLLTRNDPAQAKRENLFLIRAPRAATPVTLLYDGYVWQDFMWRCFSARVTTVTLLLKMAVCCFMTSKTLLPQQVMQLLWYIKGHFEYEDGSQQDVSPILHLERVLEPKVLFLQCIKDKTLLSCCEDRHLQWHTGPATKALCKSLKGAKLGGTLLQSTNTCYLTAVVNLLLLSSPMVELFAHTHAAATAAAASPQTRTHKHKPRRALPVEPLDADTAGSFLLSMFRRVLALPKRHDNYDKSLMFRLATMLRRPGQATSPGFSGQVIVALLASLGFASGLGSKPAEAFNARTPFVSILFANTPGFVLGHHVHDCPDYVMLGAVGNTDRHVGTFAFKPGAKTGTGLFIDPEYRRKAWAMDWTRNVVETMSGRELLYFRALFMHRSLVSDVYHPVKGPALGRRVLTHVQDSPCTTILLS
jgi:hypothetical protein